MSTDRLPVSLTDAQIGEFGSELDLIRDEVMESRGERDRKYILGVIRTQRSMALGGRLAIYASLFFLPVWGHPLAHLHLFEVLIGLGTITLGLAKILENMEIAHNVLHAQWDWMKDPEIQSNTWEWDTMGPSDRWMNSHNVVHHTWTNVLGKDLDVGYGILRMSPLQPWSLRYVPQFFYAFLLMLLFEEGVALHEQALLDYSEGRKTAAEIAPMMRRIGYKVWRQVAKDYIAWPGAAAVFTVALLPFGGPSPLSAFLWVASANFIANIIRNIWTFMIIFCGHFPADVHVFTKEQVEGETRAHWYLRQLLGSANITGGNLFHVLSGNLSHQIEHHLFPDMCSNRYPEVAPRVRALADRYGLPYNSASLTRQFGTTVWKIIRLSVP